MSLDHLLIICVHFLTFFPLTWLYRIVHGKKLDIRDLFPLLLVIAPGTCNWTGNCWWCNWNGNWSGVVGCWDGDPGDEYHLSTKWSRDNPDKEYFVTHPNRQTLVPLQQPRPTSTLCSSMNGTPGLTFSWEGGKPGMVMEFKHSKGHYVWSASCIFWWSLYWNRAFPLLEIGGVYCDLCFPLLADISCVEGWLRSNPQEGLVKRSLSNEIWCSAMNMRKHNAPGLTSNEIDRSAMYSV